jgi:pimeloyl-ACP methyl ester carboxylesterase
MPGDPLDPQRFTTATFEGRGFRQAFTHEGVGGRPLQLVHGWPETRRIWWRCIEPLAAAGFEVIAPDLRGFGDSDVAPDGFHDVPSHSRDLAALVRSLGHERVTLVGGDLGGPVVQDHSLRFPELVDRMVLFNSPLPYVKEAMAGLATRPAREASDYFVRQGTDPDGLAAELRTPEERVRYIATFYTSRFWALPGAFTPEEVQFHAAPFGDGAKLRASFGGYESAFSPAAQSEPSVMRAPNPTPTFLLFGPSDHVIYPAFDQMAEVVFPNRVGPFLLRDCGHFVQWEAADRLVSAITAWT